MISSSKGIIEVVNARAEAMFGYSRDELIGQPVESLLPVSLREMHVRHRADYVSDPHTRLMGMGFDLIGRRKDGQEFPVEVGLTFAQTSRGIQVASFISDITKRKQAEETLQAQEDRFRTVLEEELAIGHQIQLSLLPEACPTVPGWEFAAFYRSARLVGGDLYDFLELPDEPGQVGLVIADVAGKGVPAALFMALSRNIIRNESMGGLKPSPGAALRRANRSIVRDITSDYRLILSALYAKLDTQSGRLTYANGGHIWPLWLRATTGEVQPLDGRGMMLGMFRDIELEEREIEVAPGDLMVFYTDGVTEASDADDRFFDQERLRAALAAEPEASAQQVLQTVVDAVDVFTGDRPQSDDITLVVVKRLPS